MNESSDDSPVLLWPFAEVRYRTGLDEASEVVREVQLA